MPVKTFQILSDFTCDLSPALVAAADVHIIPMLYTVNGRDYLGDPAESQLSAHDFYELVRAGAMPTTAQINGETFKQNARPYLEQGLDVLYLAFSSGLSGTCHACQLAAQALQEKYPQRTVRVVDTLGASMGEGLLVYLACREQQKGASLAEVAAWTEENRLSLAHWFTVDDLHHLYRGGRVSRTAAFLGTMMNIKPVLHVDNDGRLIPMEKVRGRRQSLDALVEHMRAAAVNPAAQTVFISHGDCPADAAYVEQQVREKLGVRTVYTNAIGPVIGAHSGPGTVALFFLASTRG